MAMSRRRGPRSRVKRNQVSEMAAFYPTHDEVAARAHDLFVHGGRQIVRIPEYWREAEDELLKQAARRVIGSRGQHRA
jgi:hypothetical protein